MKQTFTFGRQTGFGASTGEGSTQTSAGTDGGQKQTQTDGQDKPGNKTFTQEELDAVIADRLKREREKTKDYADLKKKAEEYDKWQASQMTEQEKLQKELAAAQSKAGIALAAANERLIKAEVKAQALALGIIDPDAAYALMDKTSVKVDDAGNVAGVKESLEALAKAKAYLIGQKQALGSASNPGAGGGISAVEAARKLAQERNKRTALPQTGFYDPWKVGLKKRK